MANKIVDADMLDNGLTAIADSIRAKTGEQGALAFPDGFVSAVDGIEQGGDTYKNLYMALTANETNMNYLFARQCITAFPLDGMFFDEVTSASQMFNGSRNLVTVGDVSFPKANAFNEVWRSCTNLETVGNVSAPLAKAPTYLFYQCAGLKTVGSLHFPSATSVQDMFNGCTSLETIESITLADNCGQFARVFQNCEALVRVQFLSKIAADISFSASPLLDADSVANIIGALADLTGGTTQTLTLHSAVTVSDEQKATITLKNWTLVQ